MSSLVILNEVKNLNPWTAEMLRYAQHDKVKSETLRGVYTERSECAQHDK